MLVLHRPQSGGDQLGYAFARAGAGFNNVPVDACTEQGIVVFNTPGANANAVKELVAAGLLLGSRDIYAGMAFVQRLAADVQRPICLLHGHRLNGVEEQVCRVIGVGIIESGWRFTVLGLIPGD